MNVDVDVIIIGAGAAGIAAALELQKSSLSCTIFEARNRIGGRTYTDHETFVSTPVDLGGSWIHSYRPENPIYQYYQEYLSDKQIKHIDDHEVDLYLDEHGQQISQQIIEQAEEICEEIFTSLETFARTNINGNDCSVEQYIKENCQQSAKISNEVQIVVDNLLAGVENFEASNFSSLSAKQWETIDEDVMDDQWVSCGYGSVIEYLANKYKLSISKNTIVTSIDTTDKNRIAIKVANDDTVKYCRQVIITVPLGCLKRNTIKFEPPLPDWKRQAIEQMGFGLLNKLVVQFSECFWDPNATSFWHISSQQPRGRFLYTKCLSPPVNILITFVHGKLAQQLESETDEQILNEYMSFLRGLFPQSSVPNPIKYKFTRWSQDPFAYGSYSNYAVNSSRHTVKLLAKEIADGRIQWAGEHTHVDDENDPDNKCSIGYVHSAFRSGQNAAKRILIQSQNL